MDLSTDYFFKTQTLSTRKWVIFYKHTHVYALLTWKSVCV